MTEKRWGRVARGWFWLGALAFTAAASCQKEQAQTTDGEPQFVRSCAGNCSGGLTCVCGLCTKPCDVAASCTGLANNAVCVDGCGEGAPTSKVCDVSCSLDSDCAGLGAAFGCQAGRCREVVLPDGGSAGGAGGNAGSTGGRGGSGGLGITSCRAAPDPSPQLTSPTELDPSKVAIAAAVLGSCYPDDGVMRTANGFWRADLSAPLAFSRFVLQMECLANSACGCSAVENCLGYRVWQTDATCTGGCTGTFFTACGGQFDLPVGYQATIECGSVGQQCDPAAGCVDEAAVACDQASFVASCTAAGRPEFCDDGWVRHGPVCSSFGLDCVAGRCVGRGVACTDTSAGVAGTIEVTGMGCSGSTLTACVGGKTATFDCSSRGPGFTCQTVGTNYFCGLGSECTSATTCEGNVVAFCNAGRWERVDCTALGFTGCDLDSSVHHYGCIPLASAL